MAEQYTFFPPNWSRVGKGFLSGIRTVLVGHDRVPSENKVYAWCRALAIPMAFYATGLALMLSGIDNFWLGVGIGAFGSTLIAFDLYWVSRSETAGTKAFAFAVFALPAALIAWLIWQPAPLALAAAAEEGNYPMGTNIDGIQWRDGYSRLTMQITNTSGRDYGNMDVVILTDTYISQSRLQASTNDCRVAAEMPWDSQTLEAGIDGRMPNGKAITLPALLHGNTLATVNRIHCDHLSPHANVSVTFALVSRADFAREYPRKKPQWAIIWARFEAGNRARQTRDVMCFVASKKCNFNKRVRICYPLPTNNNLAICSEWHGSNVNSL